MSVYLKERVDLENSSDESLVESYLKGQAPFEELLSRFDRMIHKFSLKYYVPGITQEDLYQDLTYYLHDAALRYRTDRDTKFSTFVYQRLQTRIAWLRRNLSNQKRGPAQYDESYEAYCEQGYDPSRNCQDLEDCELLIGVDLSERERIIVEMVMEGHMQVDIAKKLKVNKKRIGLILHGLQPKFSFLLGQPTH